MRRLAAAATGGDRKGSEREHFSEAVAGFATRDFAPLCESLRQAYGVAVEITTTRPDPSGDPHALFWRLSPGRAEFHFDPAVFDHPAHPVLVERWIATVPLLLGVQWANPGLKGSAILNLGDFGTRPGLAFCESRPDFPLIPDPQFLAHRGYARHKLVYARRNRPWAKRHARAIWRGQTSGWHDCAGHPITTWRDLPRVRLCEIARSAHGADALDAGLSGIAQIADPAATAAIKERGLLRPPMPWRDFQDFKYQIDIDGNSNAWEGLFIKLCTGSCVLKVRSGFGFRQWYYDRLVPWIHYVPVAADMADLIETIDWLRRHDDTARAIGENGRALALSMTYERELILARRMIEGALTRQAL